MGFTYPTLVQAKAIPLALGGRDVLVRAATGSGKTAAYGLVALQKVLQAKAAGGARAGKGGSRAGGVRAVVLVPTRELVEQTASVLSSLGHYCSDVISVLGLDSGSVSEQAGRLAMEPDVVVATPARAAAHVKAGSLSLDSCGFLVLDEADLVLSYGHGEDVRLLTSALPRGCQGMLLSATLSNNLAELKRLVLHSPAILKLEDAPGTGPGGSSSGMSQLYVRMPRADKFLLLYALLRLKLITGKTLIFVDDVNAGYKLKMVLDRFGIRSAVLNAELPANSRASTVAGFNKGLFDLLIATDAGLEQHAEAEGGQGEGHEAEDAGHAGGEREEGGEQPPPPTLAGGGKKRKRGDKAPAAPDANKPGKKKVKASSDAEYGVSRGLDFAGVSTVLNFDFPHSATSYVHRVGRTARGGASGVALSFLAPEGVDAKADEVLVELQANQPRDASTGAPVPSALPFDVREVEPFRYRIEDQARAVTDKAIKAARLEELRREVLASAALRGHFEDNPRDLAVLQHSAPTGRAARSHLKHIPEYLLPPSLRAALEAAGSSVETVLSGGKRKKKKAKSHRERQREASQAAMSAASAAQVTASLIDSAPAPIPDMDVEGGGGGGAQGTLLDVAAADVYSRHGGMGRSGGGKSDPLRTFTYQAHKSAALGIHLPGSSAGPGAGGDRSGSGRLAAPTGGASASAAASSKAAAAVLYAAAAPRTERVTVPAAAAAASPVPLDGTGSTAKLGKKAGTRK